jgi:hypothetical protein
MRIWTRSPEERRSSDAAEPEMQGVPSARKQDASRRTTHAKVDL